DVTSGCTSGSPIVTLLTINASVPGFVTVSARTGFAPTKNVPKSTVAGDSAMSGAPMTCSCAARSAGFSSGSLLATWIVPSKMPPSTPSALNTTFRSWCWPAAMRPEVGDREPLPQRRDAHREVVRDVVGVERGREADVARRVLDAHGRAVRRRGHREVLEADLAGRVEDRLERVRPAALVVRHADPRHDEVRRIAVGV